MAELRHPPLVWVDGALMPADQARIDPADRGFTLGDSLYETIRAAGGKVLRLDRHLTRLRDGMRVLDFPPVASDHAIESAIDALLTENDLTDAAIRLTLSRGPAARGIAPDPKGRPTLVIGATPYVPPAPVTAIIAMATRRNEHSPLSRIKSTNCLDAVLARVEATKRGAQEAILLNTSGSVAEATIANIFVRTDGQLMTPRIADGALPGIMRAVIMETEECEERTLVPGDLMIADEIFLTSSLGVRPVITLDGRPLNASAAAFPGR